MTVNSYLTEQEKSILEHAVIGIAGAGGLGSNCAMHLVRSGIGKFVIADFDTVSAGNLNRQFFFADQLGQLKVEALAENLRRIEPSLELELHSCRLTAENMPGIFSGCDIVVECFDDPDSKMTLIRLMSENGRTVVAASGIAGWGKSGDIALRKVGGNCYLVGDLSSGIAENLPPFSPRVGIAAAVQANTVISILLGVEP